MKFGAQLKVDTLLFVDKKRYDLEKLVREVQHFKEGEEGYKLQTIGERSEEEKSKYQNSLKENRFRRSTSPTSKQVRDIIARRQSPNRADSKVKAKRQRVSIEKNKPLKQETVNSPESNEEITEGKKEKEEEVKQEITEGKKEKEDA